LSYISATKYIQITPTKLIEKARRQVSYYIYNYICTF